VIRLISRNCVPVALNLYEIRKAKGAGGDFFRAAQRQRPAQYQGLYLVTPDGKVLASHQNFKSHKKWSQEVLAHLEPGLKAFGEVPPREVKRADPLPHRGVGVLEDGSACLGIYLRYSIKGIPLRELPNPTIDSLVLPADQWRTLAPTTAEEGTEWSIPEDVGRQFSRVLGPGDEDTMPRPNEVKSVRLIGKVKSVQNGIAYLAYEGEISGSHNTQSNKGLCHGEAKLMGVGRYDIKAGRMLALTWVFDGVFRAVQPYDKPAKYSGVIEWRR
jgi:hypothetical protein